jgi:sugar phosphate isomerase/epimerase
MGCRSVVTLVGTRDPSGKATAPHPHLFSDACQEGLRELVPRLLDGLDPRTTKYPTEPRLTSFFYQPRAIRRFLGRLDHPARGVHLDQMNLVGWATFYRTSELIGETLGQPADRVHGVHLKDIRWNWRHQGLKRDEVAIAGGVLDYPAYPRRLAELPPDTPCYRGHFAEERDDAPSFARLHHLAERAGAPFHRRGADRSDAVRAA